ncbi:MAG: nucleoside-diphosphate sugar epimerase/dehydratase, partial [Alphaproteobacteria bacterium]
MTLMVRLESREPWRRDERLAYGGRAFSPAIIAGLAAVADTFAVLLPGMLFYLAYVGWNPGNIGLYGAALTLQILLTAALFSWAGLYRFEAITRTGRHSGRIIALSGGVFALLAMLAFALKISDQYSRVWVFASLVCTPPILCLARASTSGLLRRAARRGTLTRNIAIIGASEQARRLLERLGRADEPWNRIVGIFDDRRSRVPARVYGTSVMGRVDDLITFARENRVDEVVIALPWNAEARLNQIVHKLRVLPVQITLASDLAGFAYKPSSLNNLSGVPVLDVSRRPNAGWPQLVKIVADKILAAMLLVLAGPLLL